MSVCIFVCMHVKTKQNSHTKILFLTNFSCIEREQMAFKVVRGKINSRSGIFP